jgi:1-acyl-sn-glycerol-3-phosphate acyltransferase
VARQRLGFWFRLAVAVLKPLSTAISRREWLHLDRLPSEGGIVVAPNHLSYYDPIVVARVMWDGGRPPRFLAKSGIFDIPFIGRVVRGAGQIPVYRQSAEAANAMRDAIAAIGRGEAVVVYPEGTLTRDPTLWPMTGKTGAARIALATGCPVIPVAQWGAQRVLAPYSKRFRVGIFRRITVSASVGEPVDLSDLMGKEPTVEVLRIATDRIMAALTAQLAELREEAPPGKLVERHQDGVPEVGNAGVRYDPDVAG